MVKNMLTKGQEEGQSAETIAFVHHKGGTGKTTSCINVAGWLAKMKKRVLVVDLDPQGNATAGLGIDRKTCQNSICEVLLGRKEMEEIILQTEVSVHLAPSSMDLLVAETYLAGHRSNISVLRDKLGKVSKYFDYILVDAPPGSTLLMASGMLASENIIIPLDCGVFSYEALETLKAVVIDLGEQLGVEVNVIMMLLGGYLSRGVMREMRRLLRQFLAANNILGVPICAIPFSHKIYKSQMKGIPISHYAPLSDVGRAYKKVARVVLASREEL